MVRHQPTTESNPSSKDGSTFRVQRIQYAAATSAVSKAITMAVQVIALPVAIRALGQERFALYAVLAASLGWLGMANIGVGPPLAVGIAEAAARDDEKTQSTLVSSAFLPVFCLVTVLGCGLLALLPLIPVGRILGANFARQADTARTGAAVLLILVLTQALLSVTEAVQTGHQEQYVLNSWAAAGNLVSLVALLATAALWPSVISMIAAVHIPPVLARLLNSGFFLSRRHHLIPRLSGFNWLSARYLLGNGVIFSLAGTLGNFLNHQYIVVLVGRMTTAQITSTFAIVVNVFMLAFGMLSMIAIPLWPAIADSLGRGDALWAQRAYRKTLVYGLLYGCVFAFTFSLIGKQILALWFGPAVMPSSTLLWLTGLYFVVDTWEYIHYTILIGLRRIWAPSLIYLCRSVLTVLAAPHLIRSFGESGAMIALLLSVVLITGPILWVLVRKEFARLRPATW